MKEFVIILSSNSFQRKDCYTKKANNQTDMLCYINPVDIKNIKDIEDMVLCGVYIRLPGMWMIYFLFTIALPVRGPVAERALFKRVEKHKKIQRHKRHVKI